MKQFLFFVLLLVATSVSAQSSYPTETIEAELGGGIIMGMSSATLPYSTGAGLRLWGEVRINDNRRPIDIGLQYNFAMLWRTRSGERASYSYNMLTTLVDWEFVRGKQFSPFIGAGVGLAFVDRDVNGTPQTHMGRSVCINPRFGFEIATNYRITFDAKIMLAEYTFFSIGFGYVFGGHPTEYTRKIN